MVRWVCEKDICLLCRGYTTYKGRVNIELVADTIVNKHNGELVYGDTDSNYIYFPHMKDKTSIELWDYAEKVADEVTKLFPSQ